MAKATDADAGKEVVKVSIALPKDVHRALKHWAIDNDDVSLATAAARVIEQFLKTSVHRQSMDIASPVTASEPEPCTVGSVERQKRIPKGKKVL